MNGGVHLRRRPASKYFRAQRAEAPPEGSPPKKKKKRRGRSLRRPSGGTALEQPIEMRKVECRDPIWAVDGPVAAEEAPDLGGSLARPRPEREKSGAQADTVVLASLLSLCRDGSLNPACPSTPAHSAHGRRPTTPS